MTIQEYTDAIEVAERKIKKKDKEQLDHQSEYDFLITIIGHLKANRWERVKQLAEQPEK